jgi:hypothetical protein
MGADYIVSSYCQAECESFHKEEEDWTSLARKCLSELSYKMMTLHQTSIKYGLTWLSNIFYNHLAKNDILTRQILEY